MAAKKNQASSARVVRSLIIIVAVALLFGFFARIGMEILNRKMGLDSSTIDQPQSIPEETEEYDLPEMPEYEPVEMTETGSSVWNPDWKATPCSLFVSGQTEALLDSLPRALEPADRPTELQLLMELWADRSGYSQPELDHVWAFASGDTCFIDLPVNPDWSAVKRTIESRFISFTVLFPFVAGEAVSEYSSGMALRGIPTSR